MEQLHLPFLRFSIHTINFKYMKQSAKSTLDRIKSAVVIVKRNCKVDLEVFAERWKTSKPETVHQAAVGG